MIAKTFYRTTVTAEVFRLVRDVIRHRNILISRNRSSLNRMKTERLIGELTRNNSRNYTEPAAARFFVNHAEDILFLIKQDDQQKLTRYYTLLEKCNGFSKL